MKSIFDFPILISRQRKHFEALAGMSLQGTSAPGLHAIDGQSTAILRNQLDFGHVFGLHTSQFRI